MTKQYDLVILGGGIGGYVAAIRARQLGMSVALVEATKLGGTCLHKGCIPTKGFLHIAEMLRNIKQANQYGFSLQLNHFNYEKAQLKIKETIKPLQQGIQTLLKKNNVDVFHGFGRILGPSIFSPIPGTISIEYAGAEENTLLVPKFVLIATGSKPKLLPQFIYDRTYVLTSDDFLELNQLPKSIVIVGGGVIGVEYASMLNDLQVEVTIVESEAHLLIDQDEAIRNEIERSFKARGISVLTGVQITEMRINDVEKVVSIEINDHKKNQQLVTEKVLLSVGREANIHDIGLQNTNIAIENGYIKTNEVYQTDEAHIYAIGDCIGGLQLAHVAQAEGIIAVEHMAGLTVERLEQTMVPAAIYAHPEIAKIGLTEQKAKQAGFNIKVGQFPFSAIGKAHLFGETDGFLKMIIDEQTEDILGVHIIGPRATELISEASLAKMLNASAWEIAKTIHPHPSLTEIFPETALATEDLQIHG